MARCHYLVGHGYQYGCRRCEWKLDPGCAAQIEHRPCSSFIGVRYDLHRRCRLLFIPGNSDSAAESKNVDTRPVGEDKSPSLSERTLIQHDYLQANRCLL